MPLSSSDATPTAIEFDVLHTVAGQWEVAHPRAIRVFRSMMGWWALQLLVAVGLIVAGGVYSALWAGFHVLLTGGIAFLTSPPRSRARFRERRVHITLDAMGVRSLEEGVVTCLDWAVVKSITADDETLSLQMQFPEPRKIKRESLISNCEWEDAVEVARTLHLNAQARVLPPHISARWPYELSEFRNQHVSTQRWHLWWIGIGALTSLVDWLGFYPEVPFPSGLMAIPLWVMLGPVCASALLLIQIRRTNLRHERDTARAEAWILHEEVQVVFDADGFWSHCHDSTMQAEWSAVKEHSWVDAGLVLRLFSGHEYCVPEHAIDDALRRSLTRWLAESPSSPTAVPRGIRQEEGPAGPWMPPQGS